MRKMLLRVIPLAVVAVSAVLVCACATTQKTGSPPASPTQGPTLESYVANVCKAAAALEQSAGQFAGQFGGQFRNSSATPDGSATPDATGTPGANAANVRTAITTAANAFLNALRVANPPADLVSYNNQLITELQTSVNDIGTGNFAGGGGGFANRTPNGTPFARASGTPGPRFDGTPRTRPAGAPGANGTPFPRTPFNGTPPANGTPGANGGRGGGLARLLFRNLPAAPAQYADQLDQAATANADCQAAQFSFSGQ